MKRYVAQWKCTKWINFKDENDKPIYFRSVDEARSYINDVIKKSRDYWIRTQESKRKPRPFRIAEYIGGRKYEEVEIIAG